MRSSSLKFHSDNQKGYTTRKNEKLDKCLALSFVVVCQMDLKVEIRKSIKPQQRFRAPVNKQRRYDNISLSIYVIKQYLINGSHSVVTFILTIEFPAS